jgi:hypothetical protein
MAAEKNDAYKIFEEHLTHETKQPSYAQESELPAMISERMQYERGLRVLEDFRGRCGGEYEPFTADILQYSLLEKIPNGVDLSIPPAIGLKGLTFKKVMDRKERQKKRENPFYTRPGKPAPYVEALRYKIMVILIPRQMDIQGEMPRSKGYFLRNIRNEMLQLKRKGVTMEYCGYGDKFRGIKMTLFGKIFESEDLHLLDQMIETKDAKPLYEVSSGRDLCKEWDLDARALLSYIFANEGVDVFGKTDHVLFSHTGVFFLENGKVIQITPNDKYQKLFYGDEPEDELDERNKELQRIKPQSVSADLLKDKLHKIIDSTVDKKMSELDKLSLSPIEELERWIKENFGLETIAEGGIRNIPMLKERRYQKILIDFLEELRDILPHFLKYLFITKHRKNAVDIKDRKEIGTHFKMHADEFRLPKSLRSFIYRGDDSRRPINTMTEYMQMMAYYNNMERSQLGSLPAPKQKTYPLITLQDLRLLEEYPEYAKILYLFVFAEIFQKIIIGRHYDHKEAYEALKETIGTSQIAKERHKLQSYGFKRHDELSEFAVLINYFAHFGVQFMTERSTGVMDDKLPPSFRDYFSKHITKEHLAKLTAPDEEKESHE